MSKYSKSTGSKVFVDYENLAKNVDILKNYNPKKDIIVVCKNDAYNLGIEEVVKTCFRKGLKTFAVANLDEALRVKSTGLDVAVLVLNPIEVRDLQEAFENNLHLLIVNTEQVKVYQDFLSNAKGVGSLSFHLKFNCGMNRYGVTKAELPTVLDLLEKNQLVKENIVGLMTHFPQADEDDLSIHEVQVLDFISAYELLKDKFKFRYIHSENSAAFLLKDERLDFCNYSRIGIALYGYRPLEHNIILEPTMFLNNRVVNIRKMKAGDYLGYGENKVSEDCIVAICPLGYGDGVIGERKNYPVYIKGKKYNVVGNISMSHTYVKVDETVSIGDIVEIYGENIRFDDIKGVTNSRMMCSLKRN